MCPSFSVKGQATSGGHIKRRRLLSVLSLAIRNLGTFEITVRDESTVGVCGMCIQLRIPLRCHTCVAPTVPVRLGAHLA